MTADEGWQSPVRLPTETVSDSPAMRFNECKSESQPTRTYGKPCEPQMLRFRRMIEARPTMKCANCNERMTRRGYEHVTRVGGYTITDGTGMVETCSACGEVSLTADELAGYERRAARLILAEGARVSGPVLRFARAALGLRQRDLAAVLRRNEQQISRDEHADDLPMDLRLAVAELLERASRGESLDRVGASRERKLEVRKVS